MRKNSISGKSIKLFGNFDKSPQKNVVPQKQPYCKKVNERKSFIACASTEALLVQSTNRTRLHKRKKRKHSNSNPFTLNLYPDNSSNLSYADIAKSKAKKYSKGWETSCSERVTSTKNKLFKSYVQPETPTVVSKLSMKKKHRNRDRLCAQMYLNPI